MSVQLNATVAVLKARGYAESTSDSARWRFDREGVYLLRDRSMAFVDLWGRTYVYAVDQAAVPEAWGCRENVYWQDPDRPSPPNPDDETTAPNPFSPLATAPTARKPGKRSPSSRSRR